MEKKNPKALIAYSIALIVVGIVAIRYYYASSARNVAILGIALLGAGIFSLTAAIMYALHAKGEKLVVGLFAGSVASLFLGFSLLFVHRYELSHSSHNELPAFASLAQPIGAFLFLVGLVLLIFTVSFAIARKLKS